MFVINQTKIDNAFRRDRRRKTYEAFCIAKDKISVAADFIHESEDTDAVKSLLENGKYGDIELPTASERQFAYDFANKMQSSLDFLNSNKDAINNYLAVRSFLARENMSPENLEYYIFTNNEAGAYTIPKNIDTDIIASDGCIPAITKIVSNDPVTIVWFADGSESRVTNTSDKPFDAREGVYLAVLKKALGSQHLQHLFKVLDEVSDNVDSKAAAEDAKS